MMDRLDEVSVTRFVIQRKTGIIEKVAEREGADWLNRGVDRVEREEVDQLPGS
jgi:hypothetical protein